MSIANRLEKLRAALDPSGVDAIWVSQPENRRYMSGFSGSAGSLFITPQNALLATDSRYTEQADKQSPEYQIVHMAGPGSDWFKEMLASMGDTTRIGFEESHVTVATHKRLANSAVRRARSLYPSTRLSRQSAPSRTTLSAMPSSPPFASPMRPLWKCETALSPERPSRMSRGALRLPCETAARRASPLN